MVTLSRQEILPISFFTPILLGSTSKRNKILQANKFFPFRLDPILEWLCYQANRKSKKLYPFIKTGVKHRGSLDLSQDAGLEIDSNK